MATAEFDPVGGFLLAFPALISIVNPIGAGLVVRQATLDRPDAERITIERRVGIYSACVMLGSLWLGSYVLAFFGITLPALRVAGGLLVGMYGLHLLNAPEQREQRKREQAAQAEGAEDIAFYPLTLPVTTGPGTISVAVALGAGRPSPGGGAVLHFMAGMSAAALATALVIWICCRSADWFAALLGPGGSRVVTRLTAFLLLCIGVQILIAGVEGAVRPLIEAAHH
jgi:multiple antibiotic resistance protein